MLTRQNKVNITIVRMVCFIIWSSRTRGKKTYTHNFYQLIFGQRQFTYGHSYGMRSVLVLRKKEMQSISVFSNCTRDTEAEEDKTVKEKIFAPLFFRRVYLCLHMKWILVDACFRCFCFAIVWMWIILRLAFTTTIDRAVCVCIFITGRVESITTTQSHWKLAFFNRI